jgi:hypothetical protein
MQRLGEQLFADPGFACKEHGDIRRRDTPDRLDQIEHPFGRANQSELLLRRLFGPQCGLFTFKLSRARKRQRTLHKPFDRKQRQKSRRLWERRCRDLVLAIAVGAQGNTHFVERTGLGCGSRARKFFDGCPAAVGIDFDDGGMPDAVAFDDQRQCLCG